MFSEELRWWLALGEFDVCGGEFVDGAGAEELHGAADFIGEDVGGSVDAGLAAARHPAAGAARLARMRAGWRPLALGVAGAVALVLVRREPKQPKLAPQVATVE